MNIIFFGNGSFGSETLKLLSNSNHNLKALVTNTRKKKGRGLLKSNSHLFSIASNNNIKVIQEDNISHPRFINQIKKFKPDIFIVISYKIIPKILFEMPTYGAINLHASYLPAYRGSSPIQRALMNGDSHIGLTTFIINNGIDKGSLISQKMYDFDCYATYSEVHNILSQKGSALIKDSLDIISNKSFVGLTQCNADASFAKKINKSEYRISFNFSAEHIHNKIRALTLPGSFCYLLNKRLKLFDTFYLSDNTYNLKIGEYMHHNNKILIGCKDGVLLVSRLQFEGKRIISSNDFKNMNNKISTFT